VADVYCSASNAMLKVEGSEASERCITDPNHGIVLEPGNRFVNPETPMQMQGDFADVMFEKTETGARLVFSEFAEAPAESFWLDTALTSRNPHEVERYIASCYMLGEGPNGTPDPICAEAGASSAITIPTNAVAMGYSIALSENLEMPWQNDVSISIPGTGAVQAQSWNIEVAREEADPVIEGVSVAFASHTFQQNDQGWTFGSFAPIEGKFNKPLTLQMDTTAATNTGANHDHRACYIPAENADPVCSMSVMKSKTATIQVAPGAVSVGYAIDLPEPMIGNDWTYDKEIALVREGVTYGENIITLTRPNEAAQGGTVPNSFSQPYTFAADQTGNTYGEFIAIEGTRNVEPSLHIRHKSGQNWRPVPCYKTSIDGEPTCASNSEYIKVPFDAVEVGYRMNLPAEYVGADYSSTNLIQLTAPYGGGSIINDDFVMIRENTAYKTGTLSAPFDNPQVFAEEDTGWTTAEWRTLEGETNHPLNFTMIREGNSHWDYRTCYRMTVGGADQCTDGNSTVPAGAAEVGYMLKLPPKAAGNPSKSLKKIQLSGGATTLVNEIFEFQRPNAEYDIGTLSAPFSNPVYLDENASGWTDIEWRSISGQNHYLTFEVARVSGPNFARQICIRDASGKQTCDDEYLSVPPSTTEVGYRIALSAPTVGSDTTVTWHLDLGGYGANPDHINENVVITRPGKPEEAGSTTANFSASPTFAAADTGWKEVEYVGLTSDRNIEVTMRINNDSGATDYNRRACYKMSDGSKGCGNIVSHAGEPDVSWINVPVGAVSAGYDVELPPIGTAISAKERVRIYHDGGTLQDVIATVSRPAS
jgi:hypothetical protein